jgi:hypothetical protein
MASSKDDLTKAALLWIYDHVLDGGVTPMDQHEGNLLDRGRKIAYSELKRLGLIDALGILTPAGKKLLGIL